MKHLRVGLLVFGGGLPNWRAAGRRLIQQAQESGRFRISQLVTDKSLAVQHSDFFHAHRDILNRNTRGFGYWIWKPYLISHAMRLWQEEIDCLLYLDAGCEINGRSSSERRWHEYLDMTMAASGPFAMSLPGHPEQNWSKQDTMDALGLDLGQRHSDQVQATPMLRMCPDNFAFVSDWLAACLVNDYHLVDDSVSVAPNAPGFRDHRHDQAIFSALIKIRGGNVIPDETFWAPNWIRDGGKFPIWAPRNRTRFSVVDRSPSRRAVCFAEKAYSRAYLDLLALRRRRLSHEDASGSA